MPSSSRSNKWLIVTFLVLISTLANAVADQSNFIIKCLDDFKQLRNSEYASKKLSDDEFCNKNKLSIELDLLKNSIAEGLHQWTKDVGHSLDGYYAEAAIDQMDKRDDLLMGKMMILVHKLDAATCQSFLSNVLLQIAIKYSLRNEYSLRKKVINQPRTSKSLLEVVLEDDFYPHCQLMTFTDSNQFANQLEEQLLLANQKWSKRDELIFKQSSPLKRCLDDLARAYHRLDKAKFRLAQVFSRAVGSTIEKTLATSEVLESFKHGFDKLKSEKELQIEHTNWTMEQARALSSRLKQKYGWDKSDAMIAELVSSQLVPACESFLDTFKQVFEGDYVRKKAKTLAEAIVNEHAHTSAVQSFISVWAIYHDCYLLTQDDTRVLVEMIREPRDSNTNKQTRGDSLHFQLRFAIE